MLDQDKYGACDQEDAERTMRKLARYLRAFGSSAVDIAHFVRVEGFRDDLAREASAVARILELAD